MNKKVLLLAHDFPPMNTVGARRPYSWFKDLQHHGFQVDVVTLESETSLLENGVHRVTLYPDCRDKLIAKHGLRNYVFIRKLLSLLYSIFSFYSFSFDNKRNIYFKGEELLKSSKYDFIIASGGPFILFRYASKLSQKHSIPWISDYRDGWSTNYLIHDTGIINRFIYKTIYRQLEKKYLKNVLFGITVNKILKNQISSLHSKKDFYIVRNGYEEEFIPDKYKGTISEKLTIAYAGTILSYQRLDVFMEGLEDFLDVSKAEIKVVFYGLKELVCEHLSPELQIKPKYRDMIVLTNLLSREELYSELIKADLFLLLANDKIDGSCTKIFDYLALQKPILLTVNDHGTLELIMNETNAGYICNSKNDVTQTLIDCYQEYILTGTIKSKSKNWSQFERKIQSAKFANLLKDYIVE